MTTQNPATSGDRILRTIGAAAFLVVLAACGGTAANETVAEVAAAEQSNTANTDSERSQDFGSVADPENNAGTDNASDAESGIGTDDTIPDNAPENDGSQNAGVQNNDTAGQATENLINPSGAWPTWSGVDSGISYDAAFGGLVLPAPGEAGDVTSGVQRYLQQLPTGNEFGLEVTAASPGAGATLFLFGPGNKAITFNNLTSGVTATSHVAANGSPVRFTAPLGVTGFAVQVQGPWQATTSAQLRVSFKAASGGTETITEKLDYRPNGYEDLVMSDEFNGTALDRSQWCTRLAYGGGPSLQVPDAQCTSYPGMGVADYANVDENQRFRDFNRNGRALHELVDGVIKLNATNTGAIFQRRFESAALRSKKTFRPTQTRSYYLTARVMLPDVLGIWPAFFIIPGLAPNGEAQWPPEVDIFEGAINGGQGENAFTLIQHAQVQGAQTVSGSSEWFYGAPGFETAWGYWRSPENLRNRWIEVGMEWTYNSVCYFVDGLRTGCENYFWVTNNGVLANPAELVMLLAVGGPWAGRNGVDDSAFPTQMTIDHIRVYQN